MFVHLTIDTEQRAEEIADVIAESATGRTHVTLLPHKWRDRKAVNAILTRLHGGRSGTKGGWYVEINDNLPPSKLKEGVDKAHGGLFVMRWPALRKGSGRIEDIVDDGEVKRALCDGIVDEDKLAAIRAPLTGLDTGDHGEEVLRLAAEPKLIVTEGPVTSECSSKTRAFLNPAEWHLPGPPMIVGVSLDEPISNERRRRWLRQWREGSDHGSG